MAERTNDREKLVARISALTDVEVAELLDYVTIMETMRTQVETPGVFEDELISMLVNSRESKRARTVFEWERVRRRADRVAFSGLSRGFSA